MKYVEITVEAESAGMISKIAQKHEILDFRLGIVGEDGKQIARMLVTNDKIQLVLDDLQVMHGRHPFALVVVLPVEISLPEASEEKRKEEDAAISARESLYEDIEKNTRLNLNFVILMLLSTCVGAVGLLEDDVTIVIGAMVIAPLLGPNLAFGLGTALGDADLMRKSALSGIVGILLAIILSFVISIFWPFEISSLELTARTKVGIDSIVLALASGAAAALSLTMSLSNILVGVMVAVALLPPAATIGIMLGQGNTSLAIGAGLLLSVNVVCINLASKIVFFFKGIHPRTWLEKKKAKHSMIVYVFGWIVTLIILVFIIYTRRSLAI